MGFGSLALGTLMAESGLTTKALGADAPVAPAPKGFASSLGPKAPQFAAKAKRVIHIFMNGGPSQVDTFDPKPSLTKYDGKPIPLELRTERKTGAAMASPFAFKKYGQSGIEVSDLFAHVGECIDDICVIRSMHADVPNHEPSLMLMNCGEARQARPSVGSWLLYGLGSENQNLPGFVVLCPGGMPISEAQNWQVGVPARDLPGDVCQQPAHRDRAADRAHQEQADRARRPAGPARPLDAAQPRAPGASPAGGPARGPDPVVRAGLPDAVRGRRRLRRLEGDPQEVKDLYGPGVQARQLLVARRLLERGVRYVQVYHGAGQPWDSHDDIGTEHKRLAEQCDRPIAALLKDLKRSGMLDDTW